jgi:hypothetical protein
VAGGGPASHLNANERSQTSPFDFAVFSGEVGEVCKSAKFE